MRLEWLVQELRSAGVTVSEVPDWRTRGKEFPSAPKVLVDHHTAGGLGSPAPSLSTVIRGRPADRLPGPLCNVLTARDSRVYVIAAGVSNNAGHGGYARYAAVGNAATIGHEIEHTGNLATEPLNLDQLETAAQVDAVICRRMGWDALRCIGHKEWAPGRKVDPVWSQDDHVGRVARLLNTPPPPPPPPPGAPIMAADLTGIILYVDRCYEAAGRPEGNDLPGRRYWTATAAKAADPWPVLDQMWALLAPGK